MSIPAPPKRRKTMPMNHVGTLVNFDAVSVGPKPATGCFLTSFLAMLILRGP